MSAFLCIKQKLNFEFVQVSYFPCIKVKFTDQKLAVDNKLAMIYNIEPLKTYVHLCFHMYHPLSRVLTTHGTYSTGHLVLVRVGNLSWFLSSTRDVESNLVLPESLLCTAAIELKVFNSRAAVICLSGESTPRVSYS